MTAVYTPARSFFCEMPMWHPQEHSRIAQRLPQTINSMQDLEFLNSNSILFHDTALISAGHADLEFKKPLNEYGIRNRDKTKTTVISDSGGFQIASGSWNVGLNPMDAKFLKLRQNILNWQQQTSDWAVTLDVPYMIFSKPKSQMQTGITCTKQALSVIVDNMDYYMSNSTGQCGWLNALQGRTFAETDEYFDAVKDYNTPGYRNDYCRGWAFGNLQSSSAEATIRRLVILKHRGYLQHTKRIHLLGKSKLYQTVLFDAVSEHFPDIVFTYDSSSPYLQAAKGQLITGWDFTDRWVLNIEPIPWNQKHKGSLAPALSVINSKQSQVMKNLCAGDIIQANNKSGLDAISYVLIQHHNLDVMLQSQQAALQAFGQGQRPQELQGDVDILEMLALIFSSATESQALQHLNKFSRALERVSNHKMTVIDSYNNLFEEV